MAEQCPRTFALSALLDRQLPPRQFRDLLAHIEHCAACGEMLRELETLHSGLQALPQERLGFDLGAVIEARLRVESRRSRTARRTALHWLLFPLGGAAALTLGLHLGSTLLRPLASDLPNAPAMLTMAVFDPVPPGNLCPVPKSCPSGNGLR